MNFCRTIIVILILLALSSTAIAGWQEDIDKLLAETDSVAQNKLITKIVKAKPDWRDVVIYLENKTFPPVEQTGLILRTTTCIDDVERPWVIYVPPDYEPSSSTPLFVYLHGGVSRSDIYDEPLRYAQESLFYKMAEKHGWFIIYPMGQAGATWWDEIGMANIANLVRTVKSEFNIDDDRVWLGGFSDGASAAFLHAMVAPSDYGAFIALNGHMGVGSEDGDLPTFAPNFYNTPVYATTTDRDQLYASNIMRATIDMARKAGGEIFYRELEGQHNIDDIDSEIPLISRFLDRHPRNPFPNKIIWETAEKKYGQCRWFAIDKVTIDQPEIWHTDHNVALIDDHITVGFMPADYEDSIGVKVDRLADGNYLAHRIGLQAGDIIIQADGMAITALNDLSQYKAGLKRGDYVELVVKRNDKKVTLKGQIPEPENYNLFFRKKPSALVKVGFASNRIDIDASRVGAFRILIHPDMVHLDQNLVIRVNGDVIHNEKISPDLNFILNNFVKNRDRLLIYVAELRIKI